ncbi:VanW family protein [Lysinibacillus sphaericus]|uniref:VanW family protein n=1 Tax=Lysinibacillus sphaericus TaxID=1421 RepID=UPI001F549476|nr:VanW family protein [Lysinibacillus sphaericus]
MSGASVFYNYIDLRFYNPTSKSFQIKVWVTDKHLKGANGTNAKRELQIKNFPEVNYPIPLAPELP